MTHDSKKFIRTQLLALVIGMVFALFAYTCSEVPVFVGAFSLIADLVFISIILSLRANYKRFHYPVYLYMFIVISVFTIVVTALAVSQLIAIL